MTRSKLLVHYCDHAYLIPCATNEKEPRSTDIVTLVTCPHCREVLSARELFRRTVEQLVPSQQMRTHAVQQEWSWES